MSLKMKYLPLISILLLSQASFAKECQWPEMKALTRGSPISTFTFDFWRYGKQHFSEYFSPELQVEGPVTGDFNFNNLGVYYSPDNSRGQLAVIDLDDSGEASLFLDYVKFTAFLYTQHKKTDFEAILKSYRNGLEVQVPLSSSNQMIPPAIQELLKMSRGDFEEKQNKYVMKKMKPSGTAFDEDFATALRLLSNRTALTVDFFNQQLAGMRLNVLDKGYKYNESGSSIDMLRLLALTQRGSEYSIYELKEMRCPGTETYKHQTDENTRISNIAKQFYSDEFWDKVQATKYLNFQETNYILRRKTVNLVEKLDISKMKRVEYMPYAEFYAYYLGHLHAKSATDQYKRYLDNHLQDTAANAKRFVEAYLNILLNL